MDVYDFTVPWNMSDAYLVAEGQRIYINRSLLGVWSPYWFDKFKMYGAYETVLPSDKHFSAVLDLMKLVHMPQEKVTCEY